ncbi:matrix metalloproteinase-2 isoform X2 [Drosophila grimshawi]|nr:matrix metalloproteinase-2 isoform X2 [Drosophila grimshawi]
MPDVGKIRKLISRALLVWENHSKLTFREVYSSQADIQVMFVRGDHGDGYKFDGPGLVLAHAFYPGVGRGGDAHFDADENWDFDVNSSNSEGTNFLNVALHELGHSLGLGHSSDENAVMFPWYQNIDVNGKLPDDDRNGIQELYGAKDKVWGPYRPRPTTRTTTTTTTTIRSLTYYPKRPINYYPNEDPTRDRAREERIRQEQERERERERDWQRKREQERDQERERERAQERERELERERERERQRRRDRVRERQQQERERVQQERERARERDRNRDRELMTTSTTTSRPYNYPITNRPNKPQKPRKPKPATCMTSYDAISMIRSELFIFRGQFVWRIGRNGLYPGYPAETRRHWPDLPEDFNRVDAVYENSQHQIVFFVGRRYYIFDTSTLAAGYPQPLTSLGLPPTLTHVDAAFVWGHNNRTYLTSGTLYWSINDHTGKVDLDYPRDMSIWAGVGYNIDSAFQYTDGKTYFFKNYGYWEFNDDRMKVAHPRPRPSSRRWMQCARSVNEVDEEQGWTAPLVSAVNETTEGNSATKTSTGQQGLLLVLVVVLNLLARLS